MNVRHIIFSAFVFLLLPAFVFAQQGCCSWHGGVNYCDASAQTLVCNDGTYSPTCGCPGPTILPPTPSEIVTKDFKALFHRTPEPLELNYWVTRYYYSPGMQNNAVLNEEMKEFLDLGYSYGNDKADAYKPLGQVKAEIQAELNKINSKDTPGIVEREFVKIFGKKPNAKESTYWKARARSDKKTINGLDGAMLFQKAKGLTMSAQPKSSVVNK